MEDLILHDNWFHAYESKTKNPGVKYCVCRQKEQELFNLMGAMYSAIFFLGAYNASSVQPVVAIERTAFHRERAAGMYSAIPYAFAQVN